MVKISGIQPISNGVSLGYPFIEAILSVLPIVDEFLINDGGSSDKTSFYLKKLEKTFPDKIRLFNKPFYPSPRWETIDDCVEFLIKKARGDWIFEVQGDEIWDEKYLLDIRKLIEKVSEEGYNSIRTIEGYTRSFDSLLTGYKYKYVRIVRNLKDLKNYWGGDDFHLGNDKHPVKGFTTSNVPPELFFDKYVTSYNVGYKAFPDNALGRTEKVFKFFAKRQKERKNAYIYEATKRRGNLVPNNPDPSTVIKLPALIRGLVGLRKYKVRDELFDKGFLNKLTGLNYS